MCFALGNYILQAPPPILKAEADWSLWVDLETVPSASTIHPAHTNM